MAALYQNGQKLSAARGENTQSMHAQVIARAKTGWLGPHFPHSDFLFIDCAR
ncbi:hypothetical protein [Herminiimonas sp.]|uniref:hypothetical protein n=1 Tax=Herminiimonas sp. TaxID=1926289 RepID=UPI0027204D11|nr:hypothetical protein [Herminiimonas sp.]MDO8305925.1 hypothetical protein [Herminiimonas sp.]